MVGDDGGRDAGRMSVRPLAAGGRVNVRPLATGDQDERWAITREMTPFPAVDPHPTRPAR